MLRLFAALLLVCPVALAEDPPVRPLPPKPAEPLKGEQTVTLKTLNAKDGLVVNSVIVPEQYTFQVPVTTVVDGQTVTTYKQETAVRMVVKESKTKIKDLKATGTDGKDIPGEELERSLKDGGLTVVAYAGTLDEKARKLFKDGTVFVEQAALATPAPVAAPPKPEK